MREIALEDLRLNPFSVFGKDWMALAAGNNQKGYNAMTIAWGHLGTVWERGNHRNCLPTAICYVRPSRYTKEFVDREELFTLSHFPSAYQKALGYLGSHSGRNGDKAKEAGLTPVFLDGTTYFAQADLVFICRKLYSGSLTENGFTEQGLVEFNYPERDFHTMYVGEIVKVLVDDKVEPVYR